MSAIKRLSFSGAAAAAAGEPLHSPPAYGNPSADEWTRWWEQIPARDLVDHAVVVVNAGMSVDEACERLLAEDLPCIAVSAEDGGEDLLGLFDYADVNAFLTLAATQHTLTPDELEEHPRAEQILAAARSGKVPVRLVSNLSEKNALEIAPADASLLTLLSVFSRGIHRVLIRAPGGGFAGFVTDRAALAHIARGADARPPLARYLTNALGALGLPSLYLFAAVVSVRASASVLDAMRRMSEDGVSSVAVLEENSGALLSAVSVTDIGKVVVPTQSNHILGADMMQLISTIRAPLGETDGVEHYSVYSVTPDSTLEYTIQKLIATNSHRLFVTASAPSGGASPASPSPTSSTLSGVVSIVDILALFARIANVPGVDPRAAQSRRRLSTSSSRSGGGSSRSSSLSSSRVRTDSGASAARVRTDSGASGRALPINIQVPRAQAGLSPQPGGGSPVAGRYVRGSGSVGPDGTGT